MAMAVLMAFALFAGCGGKKEAELLPSPAITEAAQATPAPAQIVESLPYANLPTLGAIWDSNYEDGGLDGVGTIIGNTDGNIANGGLAVENDEKTHVFYRAEPDSFSEEYHIIEYNRESGAISLVFECGNDRRDYPYLNFLGGQLWFKNGNKVYSYNSELDKLSVALETDSNVWSLRAAYGYLYIETEANHDTLCFDITLGKLTHQLQSFSITNIMDGRLYGSYFDSDTTWQNISMTPDGRNLQKGFGGGIVANGKCYWWAVGEGECPEDGEIYVQDMHTGEICNVKLPNDFFCYDLVNVSHDYIYVKDWVADDWGYAYAIRIRDEKWMGRISDYLYYYEGFCILDGKPEWDAIPYQSGVAAESLN